MARAWAGSLQVPLFIMNGINYVSCTSNAAVKLTRQTLRFTIYPSLQHRSISKPFA
jgi:hypothetical protein